MKKRSVLFTSFLLVALLIAGGTFAWFTAEADPVTNEFTAGTLLMSINESYNVCDGANVNPGDCIDKSVVICNDGTKRMFARVIIDAKFEDNLETAGVVSYELGEGWVKEGNHYYFNKSVAPGCCTPPLFSEVCFDGKNMNNTYQGKRFNLIINSQSVQATNNAAESVWGPGIPNLTLLEEGDCGPCLPVSQVKEEL